MEEAQEVKKPNQKEKRGGDACVAVGCNSNYASCKEKVSVFTFPKEEERPELRRKWEQFVNRGDGWKAQKRSVLCEKHFEAHHTSTPELREIILREN